MSHDPVTEDGAHFDQDAKLVRMANQIGTFFESKPRDEGVAGVAEHINKFWEPRMRRRFFAIVDGGGKGLMPIVMEAAKTVRRPADQPPTQADQGAAEGEAKAETATGQG